jgi:outer membrane protein OmpA-like peptidoglycan-associated protein
MKRIGFIALCALALPAVAQPPANTKAAAPPKLYDLSGEWQAAYKNPGSVDIEKVMIANLGTSLVATKETGDVYVPAGKVTFKGDYVASPFPIQYQTAQTGYVNPGWIAATITVSDQDHFTITTTANGKVESWQRIGRPTLALDNAILFDVDKSALKPAAVATLDQVVAWLRDKHPASHLLVAGYTDDTGGDAHNLALSQRRAASVAVALKARGVAPARLATKGFGKANPRYPNTNDDARAHNRRVEIVIED